MKKKSVGARIYMGLVYFFLYLPIFVLIIFSFNDSKSRTVWAGFTLKWYGELFKNKVILDSVRNTLVLALTSSVIATFIGTSAAIGIFSMKKRARIMAMYITYLPTVSPEIVTGVSLMLLFTMLNLPFGFLTLLLAHVTFNIPYVILNVMPKLRQMDKHLYEAAQDLGCNPFQAFTRVVIPEITPGIISGFLMAITYSIDDFVISFFTSGPQAQTLPITIFSMTRRQVNPQINALSTLMFLLVLTILIVYNFHEAKEEKKRQRRTDLSV